MTTPSRHITIRSQGYLHSLPADLAPADITLDLRRLLADPAHVPDGTMLDMTGLDPAVRTFVFATPGALDLVDQLGAAGYGVTLDHLHVHLLRVIK